MSPAVKLGTLAELGARTGLPYRHTIVIVGARTDRRSGTGGSAAGRQRERAADEGSSLDHHMFEVHLTSPQRDFLRRKLGKDCLRRQGEERREANETRTTANHGSFLLSIATFCITERLSRIGREMQALLTRARS